MVPVKALIRQVEQGCSQEIRAKLDKAVRKAICSNEKSQRICQAGPRGPIRDKARRYGWEVGACHSVLVLSECQREQKLTAQA